MSTVPIVRVEHLVKRYQESGRAALNDVSFEVAEGAFFALLGPNGAGKTTAISVLVTTLAKTSGFVSVGGVELDRDPRGIRSQIGVVFQSPSLDEELSGEQNVRIEACLYGMYAYRPLLALMPRTYLERVQELAVVFGLDEVIARPVRTYSGGMRRKLEIVRCLIHRPRVLFLDEPTTGLDPESRHAFWEYVHRAWREHGITVVLTTHYLAEAEAADAVCVIDRGTVSISGSPDELKRGLVDRYVEVDADDRGASLSRCSWGSISRSPVSFACSSSRQ